MAPLTHLQLGEPDSLRPRGRLRALGQAAWRSQAARYVAALAFVGLAVAVKSIESLGLGSDASGSLLIGAIAAAAAIGGVGPALVAFALSLAAFVVWFPPGGGFSSSRHDLIPLAAFVAEAVVVVAVIALLRRHLARLRSERGRDAVLAVIAEQAVAGTDEPDLFRVAVERVGTVLRADRAALFVQDGGLSLAAQWRWDDAPVSVDGDVTSAWLASCLKPGRHVFDPKDAPPELRASFPAVTTSVVSASMELSGSRAGILALFRRLPEEFTNSDRAFVETVAAILTTAAQRRATEAALARSNERLRVAQNAAHAGTWEWDLSTQTMLWSDGIETLHGIPPGRFPRTAPEYIEIVHPDDREKVRAAAMAAGESGRFDVRYRVNLPDGAVRWVAGRGQVFPGADGRPVRVVGAAIDVTEQVRVEDAVRANEERFRMMANAAPVLIRVSGAEGDCLFVNERWSALTGRSPADHLGQGWLESVHPDDRDACRAALARSVAARTPAQWEYRIRQSSGEYRWVLDSNAPVEAADGSFVGFVASSTDITQRRQAEDAVRLVAEAGIELGASLDYTEILNRLADFAVPRFADWCVVHAGAENARIPRKTVVRGHAGISSNGTGPSDEVIRAACIGVAEGLARSGQTSMAIAGTRLGVSGDSWDIGPLRDLGVRSGIAVSLAAQNGPLGAILFLRGQGRKEFQPEDRTLAEDLGRRTSAAIENARLYSRLADREADLERVNEFLTFLLDASSELASTMDPDEMLARLVNLATPRIADWCTILVGGADEHPRTLAIAHADETMSDVAKAIVERFPLGERRGFPLHKTLTEGVAQFYPTITEEMWQQLARDEEHLQLIRRMALRSSIIVPLASANRVYAAMAFGMSHSGRTYTEADFATLKELGRRAGVALENANLYSEGQQRENDLMRANEAKDEFLGMMSHELRTPLTIINGGARVLRSRSGEIDGDTRDAILSDIEGESERLFRMVENLLSLAHLQFGDSFEVEPVHIGRLTEKVLASFAMRRPNRPVSFEVEAGAETFAAQPVYLEQVIRNLLSNADKYSPAGAPIELRAVRTGEGIGEFRVLDRGVGINPEEASLIFERFYRSERTSRLAGGSGVGLALCKRLIEAMSGQIWARPRDGGGLEVGFSLPLYEEAFV